MLPVQHYRSRCGRHYFTFRFAELDNRVDIYCLRHPPLGNRDADVNKTHLFESGRMCFIAGREPTTMSRALELAKQWSEYFIEYCRTGVPQS